MAFPVMGRGMTLDQIEHERLRAELDEPRIHLALACASMGCPALRRQPYTGEGLEDWIGWLRERMDRHRGG